MKRIILAVALAIAVAPPSIAQEENRFLARVPVTRAYDLVVKNFVSQTNGNNCDVLMYYTYFEGGPTIFEIDVELVDQQGITYTRWDKTKAVVLCNKGTLLEIEGMPPPKARNP